MHSSSAGIFAVGSGGYIYLAADEGLIARVL